MNTAVKPLSIPRAGSAESSAGRPAGTPIDHLLNAVWRALRAVADYRAGTRLDDIAADCEALQPSLAREIRAAGRLGPIG